MMIDQKQIAINFIDIIGSLMVEEEQSYISEDPSMIFKGRPELRNKGIECLMDEVFLPKTKAFLIGIDHQNQQYDRFINLRQ